MIKLLLSFILIFIVSFSTKGQQVPQYSQWFWHLQANNPAFTGLKPCLEIKTLYRNQWANLPGSPNSGFFTLNLPIYTKQKKIFTPRQGIGFKFESDKIGAFSMNRFVLNYAGHFNFTTDTRLSIGLSAGVKQWVFDREKVTTLELDPLIQESASLFSPDAAIGVWWNGKNYFLSFTLSELINSNWNPLTGNSKYLTHSYLSTGTRFVLNDNFTLLPYLMLRIPSKGPVSADLDFIVSFKNKIDVGIGLRNVDAISGFFQYKFQEKFALAYSVDYVMSSLANGTIFSHEFSLIYGSCKIRNTNTTVCPLF